MSTPKKNSREVKAIVRLLEQDQEWATPADFAVALIQAVDEARLESEPWIGVLQFGVGSAVPFYVALGPYPGRKTALNALRAHPAASEAVLGVVAPLHSEAQLTRQLADLDESPVSRRDWEEVRKDAIAFKRGWRGPAATRDRFLEGRGAG